MLRTVKVRIQDAHPANKYRHFRSRKRQQLRFVNQQLLRGCHVVGLQVISEPIRLRFERSKRFHIGLLLRGIGTSGRERNLHLMTGILGRLFNARASAENNQVGKGDLLAARLRGIELVLNAF